MCLQVFRYIQQVNETKKGQLQSSDYIPTFDQHHKPQQVLDITNLNYDGKSIKKKEHDRHIPIEIA